MFKFFNVRLSRWIFEASAQRTFLFTGSIYGHTIVDKIKFSHTLEYFSTKIVEEKG